MANNNTIEEFLVGLGVKVDVKEFFVTIDNMGKAVGKFMLGLEGLIIGLKAALIKTAEALENLYYVAQRANTTVDNLRELQYGMRQIGLGSEDASQALESLAMAMRINPGNEGLLKHLGIQTREVGGGMRDTTKIMGDFIGRLSKMPFYVAVQYAEMFGINARTLTMLLANFSELQAKEAEWRDMARRTGVDLQDSAKKSHEFMSSIRALGEVIELMWIKVSTVLITRLRPEIDAFTKFLLEHNKEITQFAEDVGNAILGVSDDLIGILPQMNSLVQSTIGWKGALEGVADVLTYRIFGPVGAAILALYELKKATDELINHPPPPVKPGSWQDWLGWMSGFGSAADNNKSFKPGSAAPSNPTAEKGLLDKLHDYFLGSIPTQPLHDGSSIPGAIHPGAYKSNIQGTNAPDLFKKLEAAYQLPGNFLDSVWRVESARGQRMLSGAGARGHFQFMPDTARDYGVSDPNDLTQSANGAARYFHNLLEHYKGDIKKALAGYNWGEGHLDKDIARNGMGWMRHIPAETSDYIDKVLRGTSQMTGLAPASPAAAAQPSVTLHQKTDIVVHGSEAHSTGKAVSRQQEAVNSSIVRQFRTAIVA